jgi:hypothetical protein
VADPVFLGQPPDDLTGLRTYQEVKDGWASYAAVKSYFPNYNFLLYGGAIRPGLLDKKSNFSPAAPDILAA